MRTDTEERAGAQASDDTQTIPVLEEAVADSVIGLRELISGRLHPLPVSSTCFSVGSAQQSDVHLVDRTISTAHCILERRGRKLVVRDLRSKNGVYVDGLRVVAAEIRPGCELQVGRTMLVAVSEQTPCARNASDQLIGQSPSFRGTIELAKRAARAPVDCSVLLLGETGTGKELIARLIHEQSPRASKPFVTVNCGGLTSALIGSELFGHMRGAFTGAGADRDGVFVQADGGTLFLDELGELPLEQQPHLLRALESGEVRPLGSAEAKRVEVRFIAATNRLDLGKGSRIRADLYHRLATITVRLPSLRARPNDVPLLVREFIRREGGGGAREISVSTMRALQAYPWHGNVRELRHAVKRALLLCSGELTLSSFLPELGDAPVAQAESIRLRDPRSLYDDGIKQVLHAALLEYGSVRRAARALGIPKSTFADRAKRLGLKVA